MKVIELQNVGKRFVLSHQKSGLLNDFLPNFLNQATTRELWALKNINMEVKSGQVVGIIGRNGAGKTTLLNILAGISIPTEGKVDITGKVSTLLTLGAGFQEELSGRENIYLNASILGMNRKEIKEKFPGIIDFSELDGFLDVPLRTYSQGMLMRLGFSIATHIDFDILLTDEVLYVGDVLFQKKCYEKIVDFKRHGKTMIITTQDLTIIERLCDKVFLLENGSIEAQGEAELVVGRYLKLLNERKFSETRCQ